MTAQLAKDYRDQRGWRPFPLDHPTLPECASAHLKVPCDGKRGKHPVGGWRTMAASEPTDQILDMWFREPRNIGIGCGESGIVVLDEDQAGEVKRLFDAHGHDLPNTLVVRTGRGRHYIFTALPDLDVTNSDKAIAGYSIDVRGKGGLIVAPGSLHENGTTYEFDDPYVVPAPFPRWLGELLATLGTGDPGRAGHGDEARWTDAPRWDTAERFTEQYRRRLDAVQHKGNTFRQDELFPAARDGWRLVSLGLIERDAMLGDLKAAVVRVWGHDPDERDRQIVLVEAKEAAGKSPWFLRPDEPAGGQGGAPGGLAPFLLPARVWDFSAVTERIYRAALARLVSPDALLHAVLTVVASMLHHQSRVETGKGPSVLSYYFAAVGASGAGKSEALKVARELLVEWTSDRFCITGADGYVDGPLGSGEGLVEAFMGEVTVDRKDPKTGELVVDGNGNVKTEKRRDQVRHNALFHTDEGRQVLAIDARKGATVLSVMCEMWSGSVAGQTNADKDRSRKLRAGSYVVGMMLGFQTATVDALFADESGGAPQRFAFAPAEYAPHADAPDDYEEPWPGELTPLIPGEPVTVHLSAEHKQAVRRSVRLKAAGRDGGGPLDGHRVLLQCRVAALLALLHGEKVVTPELWELAETITRHSCALRDWLAGSAARKAGDRRRAWRAEQVEVRQEVDAAAERRTRVRQVADKLVEIVESEGGSWTRGRAKNKLPKSMRSFAEDAIALAVTDGLLIEEDRGGTLRQPDD